jgi:hypothetical protein
MCCFCRNDYASFDWSFDISKARGVGFDEHMDHVQGCRASRVRQDARCQDHTLTGLLYALIRPWMVRCFGFGSLLSLHVQIDLCLMGCLQAEASLV